MQGSQNQQNCFPFFIRKKYFLGGQRPESATRVSLGDLWPPQSCFPNWKRENFSEKLVDFGHLVKTSNFNCVNLLQHIILYFNYLLFCQMKYMIFRLASIRPKCCKTLMAFLLGWLYGSLFARYVYLFWGLERK